jgi:hypothetical protein
VTNQTNRKVMMKGSGRSNEPFADKVEKWDFMS